MSSPREIAVFTYIRKAADGCELFPKTLVADIGYSRSTPRVFEELRWQVGVLGIAFAISTFFNILFAPILMTLHEISDAHIQYYG